MSRLLTLIVARQVIKVERGTVTGTDAAALAAMAVQQSLDVVYDANGNRIRETASSGSTVFNLVQYSYDAQQRLQCTTLRMNPATWSALPGDACTATAEGSAGPDRITRNTYDANDRVILVETGVGTAIASTEVATAYTANGQTAYVTDGQGNRTTYVYDGHNRLSQTRYPVTTVGANSSNTADYEQLTYDAASRITQRRLRDGQVIGLSYDNLGRLIGRDSPGSEQDAAYTYDLAGRLVSATQGFAIGFATDALGRLVSETGAQGTVSYQYDAAGRRTRLTYTDGFYVTYDYDVVGNVTAIRENGAASGVGVLASYAYDSLGRRSSVTFGNGTSQTYAFDNADRLTSLSNDLAGTAQDMSVSYTYNPANQIASSTRNNDAYAWTGHYNVDRSSSIDGLNRIIVNGLTNIGYDGRGNLTTSGTTAYTYNANNQLLTAPGGTVGWDAVGRISKVAATGQTATRFTYDGIALLSEHFQSGPILRRYVHGPGTDQPIVWYEGSGTTDRRFLLADERGSIISVTNSSGTVLAINSYDEYGIPAATNIGRFQYTGQTWLSEIGLYHYKARMYSPTLGRFMQTDPIGYADGMNWYAYLGNDPVNFVDPLGLSRCEQIAHGNVWRCGGHVITYTPNGDGTFSWRRNDGLTGTVNPTTGQLSSDIIVTASRSGSSVPTGFGGGSMGLTGGGGSVGVSPQSPQQQERNCRELSGLLSDALVGAHAEQIRTATRNDDTERLFVVAVLRNGSFVSSPTAMAEGPRQGFGSNVTYRYASDLVGRIGIGNISQIVVIHSHFIDSGTGLSGFGGDVGVARAIGRQHRVRSNIVAVDAEDGRNYCTNNITAPHL